LNGSTTIPAGSSSATVTVTPIDDTTVESSETVILTLSGNAAYAVGSPGSATVTIADNDQPPPPPIITVVASDANASESGETGRFRLTRTGATTAALTVHYTLGGTAVNGTDYQSLSTSVTIPAGASSVEITVTPIDDTEVEGSETVVLTVSANQAYIAGSSNTATVTIADNDRALLPTISVSATIAICAEGGANATFTITRTGSTSAALTVRFALTGTAQNGIDYQQLPGSVTIPAGAASATVIVQPIDDSLIELPELVIVTLSSDPAYGINLLFNTATVVINDNDLLSLP
jgi:hypothetical protein